MGNCGTKLVKLYVVTLLPSVKDCLIGTVDVDELKGRFFSPFEGKQRQKNSRENKGSKQMQARGKSKLIISFQAEN